MAVNILTTENLNHFKLELFAELKGILKNETVTPKKWLKSDEVKKLLKVSPGTLQTLRINGTLQYTKIGGIIYYGFDHIQKTFQQNLRPANA
ncbi:MAG: helix-turn-helix domain-containing protein [Ferruginibacter sp.]